jgi:hypothetical protein
VLVSTIKKKENGEMRRRKIWVKGKKDGMGKYKKLYGEKH